MQPNKPFVIFWSWQSDNSKENKHFISKCIETAVQQLGKEDSAIVLEVDRDTKGIAGMPSIADTILSKIVSADIFIFDATLTYGEPRPAPNPNVLFELGYALAILGSQRVIGVMNVANGLNANRLPFDLVHRRWPYEYSLAARPDDEEELGYQKRKKDERDKLIQHLKIAVKAAIAAPKTGAVKNDADLFAAQNMWQMIYTDWLHNWFEHRSVHPMKEHERYLQVFEKYLYASKKPENQFYSLELKRLHKELIDAIESYQTTINNEMDSVEGNSDAYLITVKMRGYVDNYDQEYDRQKNLVWKGSERVWEAWKAYISELRSRYPEVVSS
jgi:hypothetical protein